jgi:hypothetical protein
VPQGFLDDWLEIEPREGGPATVTVYVEKSGGRDLVQKALANAILDHLVGVEVIEMLGGYEKSVNVIRNSLPIDKKIRSGDVGEILLTEHIEQQTDFRVPLKRLRYKDDRAVSMRGDDLLAIRTDDSTVKVLKAEAKSRENLYESVVAEASDALMKYDGRPNPSTLAFLTRMLRMKEQHDDAEIIERLQNEQVHPENLTHLIFTCSGNQPRAALEAKAQSPDPRIRRTLVGFWINEHQNFIRLLFEAIDAPIA